MTSTTVPRSQFDLDNLFTYYAPTGNQTDRYAALRAKGKELAQRILDLTPPGADQSAAIRLVCEAIWTANAAIACGEVVP